MRPVKSKVTPEGTATAEMMMVEQEVLDLLAEEAPADPEKVQVVARFFRSLRSGAAVGSGAAAGAATARAAAPRRRARERRTIVERFRQN